MKRTLFIKKASCIFLLLLCLNSNAQNKKGWKLIWHDEFNYTGPPDSSKWAYEVGHIRNNEQQYYNKKKKENTGGRGETVIKQ